MRHPTRIKRVNYKTGEVLIRSVLEVEENNCAAEKFKYWIASDTGLGRTWVGTDTLADTDATFNIYTPLYLDDELIERAREMEKALAEAPLEGWIRNTGVKPTTKQDIVIKWDHGGEHPEVTKAEDWSWGMRTGAGGKFIIAGYRVVEK